MLDCPKCGADAYDGTRCSACRFVVGGKSKPGPDPLHLTCEFISEGQRCAEYGGISPNTHGAGPWYCRRHYDTFVGRGEHQVAVRPPTGFAPLKAVLQRKFHVEREPGIEG